MNHRTTIEPRSGTRTRRAASFTPLLVLAVAACWPEFEEPVPGISTSPDGVPIVYDVRGEGETTVVFVHCWACNRAFWRGQVGPVEAAGFRVVTLDLPGHGESGAEREHWSVSGLAGDVESVADDLGIDRMILVGHSMGAPVSLEVARNLPDRTAGVVCVDALHDVEIEWPEGLTEQLAAGLEEDFRSGMGAFVSRLFPDDADPGLVEWVIEQGVASDQAATVGLMRDFEGWDARDALSGAGVPVRCINAEPAGPQGMATAIERNRAYGDFDATLVPGVGHYLQLERPDPFNRELIRLLRELEERAGG